MPAASQRKRPRRRFASRVDPAHLSHSEIVAKSDTCGGEAGHDPAPRLHRRIGDGVMVSSMPLFFLAVFRIG